ncbi:tyrosine-type recombinase/integrase [Arthrobacter psychrochitiniphilus]|uniref:Integrase n=1 Tax=Arthrobacter psychrochitiniphilus TaxID=291045 RepID=A0A2V3DMR9_9MICC|nr:tyrosine-type recombinase/integrase [Arthrobacter psychrochitiniphilus]NYG18031.1 site-specific recombinase XerD [Arthrobacter psychrochitiniphilus]PXA64245.1 integrase [Arthrobacter psychrochitiniphilus]
MKNTKREAVPDFWGYARNYLHHFLPQVRNLAPRSIEAYRITLESYIHYLVTEKQVPCQAISFDDFDRQIIKDWMVWMRQLKNYEPATIGLRLSAIKAFLSFTAAEEITLVALYQGAKTLKAPATPRKPIEYLQENETTAVLAAHNGNDLKSRRNRMLLILLYDSGARVGEITALTLGDLTLSKPARLVLTGKRDKSRVVPLGEKTVEHLLVYLEEFHPQRATESATRPLFYSYHRGQATSLSSDTVAVVLTKAGDLARQRCPSIPENLHCHMLRKTKAMDLYKQGVPLPIIMQLLGHESMSTTSAFYAFATLDMMREAMKAATPAIKESSTQALSNDELQLLYTLK